MKDYYDDKPTCAVTKHKVIEVARQNPEMFLQGDGEINIPRVLFYLGFDIRQKKDLENYNYTCHENFRIRHADDSTKCYITTVYSGNVRKAVLVKDGKPVVRDNGQFALHPENYHCMESAYEGGKILQADNISEFVKDEDIMDIFNMGADFSG